MQELEKRDVYLNPERKREERRQMAGNIAMLLVVLILGAICIAATVMREEDLEDETETFAFFLFPDVEGFRQCQMIGIFALVLVVLGAVLTPAGYAINAAGDPYFIRQVLKSMPSIRCSFWRHRLLR